MPNRVIIDIPGHRLTDQDRDLLLHSEVAGVLFFSRNIQNRRQLLQLTAEIHQLRPELFIAIDHEGGFIQRIQRLGCRALMSARAHGEIYQEHQATGIAMARRYGELMAQDLLACGIDSSFAPVLDLHNPISPVIAGLDRAFHADPNAVSELALAYVHGMHAAGMPATGKHFPGHGSCAADSHLQLPINTKSLSELRESDLKPFATLIQQGVLDALMPAHVIYSQVDPEFAAGYSVQWLQHILRGELNFQGLIISDCLGMKGADIGDLTTRAVQALNAGCHLLIAANQNRADLLPLLDALPSLVASTSNEPLTRFKACMQRFKANAPRLPTQSTTTGEPDEMPAFDPRNPTFLV